MAYINGCGDNSIKVLQIEIESLRNLKANIATELIKRLERYSVYHGDACTETNMTDKDIIEEFRTENDKAYDRDVDDDDDDDDDGDEDECWRRKQRKQQRMKALTRS